MINGRIVHRQCLMGRVTSASIIQYMELMNMIIYMYTCLTGFPITCVSHIQTHKA